MNHFLILIPQSLNSQFLNLAPIAIIMRIVSKKRTRFLDQITRSELTGVVTEMESIAQRLIVFKDYPGRYLLSSQKAESRRLNGRMN